MGKVIDPALLRDFALAVLEAVGVPRGDAGIVAEHLVEAELRGLDSHGVSRLPVYVQRLRQGLVAATARPAVVRDAPVAALIDGRNGLGIVVADYAMKTAVSKATAHGIGCAGVRNSNHCGYLGYYTKRAAAAGLIGFAFTNAPPAQAPWGGRVPYFGTNPLSVAVPRRKEPPIVVDMATTVAARGKIRLAAQKGLRIPEGWAIDREGSPTTDPNAALDGLILPVGGAKGYGLAMLVDILSGVLTGGLFGPAIGYLTDQRPQGVGHFFLAIRTDLFIPVEQFLQGVEEMAQQVKACPPMVGFESVLLPGEPEELRAERNQREGIPVSDAVVAQLEHLGQQLGVPAPWVPRAAAT